jgi:cobalt-zinc-cadmium efflux system protein
LSLLGKKQIERTSIRMAMADEHDHGEEGHGHELLPTQRAVTKPLVLALAITAAFAVFELVGGWLSNSLALISDAGHMFTDVLALALSLGAAIIALREPTDKQTFGYLRVEIVAALLNGIALAVLAAIIIYEAFIRFQQPQDIDAELMLMVASIGLVANLTSAFVLRKHSHDNLNVKGAFIHVLGDTMSSVGVIVAALLIIFFGLVEADPIISAIIGVIILFNAIGVVRQALNILLEFTPGHIEVEEVRSELMKVEGVEEVHDLHFWTIASGVYSMSGHIVVKDQPISACSCIISACEEVLRERFHLSHTTLQLESSACGIDACVFRSNNGNKKGKEK